MNDNAALIERIKAGDKEAQNKLVENNMGLVYSIVKRYTGRGYDFEDLVQIGAIGLIKAIKKFDTAFNVRFSTYAVPVIAGEIKRFMRDDGAVKISRTLKETAMKGWHTEEELRKKLNREPTIKEIADHCGIDMDLLTEAFDAASPPTSIYENIYEGGDKEIKLLDTMPGDDSEEHIINKVMADNILKSLKPRERQVMILRYYKGKTQSEIAKIIGVSQVQVSRIEKQIILSVRSSMS